MSTRTPKQKRSLPQSATFIFIGIALLGLVLRVAALPAPKGVSVYEQSVLGTANDTFASDTSFQLLPVIARAVDYEVPGDTTAIRAAVALSSMAGLAGLYFMMKRSYGPRAALFSSLLFASNAYAVASARYIDSLFLATNIAMAAGAVLLWTCTQSRTKQTIGGLLASLGLWVHFSYMFFLPVALFAQYRLVRRYLPESKHRVSLAAFTGALLGIGPYVAFHLLSGEYQLLGWTEHISDIGSLGDVLGRVHASGIQWVFSSDTSGVLHIPETVLVTSLTSIMAVFGILQGLRQRRNTKYQIILSSLLLATLYVVLVESDRPVSESSYVVLPFVIALAGIGAENFIKRWRDVFPRNKAAQTLSVIIVTAVIGMSVMLDFYRYFEVYVQTPEVLEMYRDNRS